MKDSRPSVGDVMEDPKSATQPKFVMSPHGTDYGTTHRLLAARDRTGLLSTMNNDAANKGRFAGGTRQFEALVGKGLIINSLLNKPSAGEATQEETFPDQKRVADYDDSNFLVSPGNLNEERYLLYCRQQSCTSTFGQACSIV